MKRIVINVKMSLWCVWTECVHTTVLLFLNIDTRLILFDKESN
jgi:hypothetical protein